MRRLRAELKVLGLAAAVVGAGLAVLSTAEGLAPAAHAQLGGSSEPGMIVAVDRGNDRLQVFYPDGTFAFKFGVGFGGVNSIDVGPDGMIVTAGRQGYSITTVDAFHPNGTYAFRVAGTGEGVGAVDSRHVKAAIGPDGRIVVMEPSRIQVFESDGTVASVFVVPIDVGASRYFRSHDIAVGPDGRIVVIGDGKGGGRCGDYYLTIIHPNGSLALSSALGFPSCDYGTTAVDVAPDGLIVAGISLNHGAGGVLVYRPLPNGTLVHLSSNSTLAGAYMTPDSGVAVGPDGRIVVGVYRVSGVDVYGRNTYTSNYVEVFHPNGSLALTFGGTGYVPRVFDRPTDAAVGPDGRIVVAEPGKHTISVFHPNGTLDFSFGSRGAGDGAFYEPHQVAVGPDGRIVVGDTRKHRILVFEPDGSPALAFGSQGDRAGQIYDVQDVAVAPNGNVVVVDDGSDYSYNRVQVFSPDGSSVFELRPSGHDSWNPGVAAVGPDGRIVVTDHLYGQVRVFDPNGTQAFTIQMLQIHLGAGIAVGPDGRIELVQGSSRHVFSPDGEFVFATEIDVLAASIAVGPDGEIVVVDDRDDRVQVFNPNGTFAFSLLPDLSEGKFNGVGDIAVGSLTPPPRSDPEPLRVAIESPDVAGAPILRNFTNVGDAANVTIDVTGLVDPDGAPLNGSESSTVTFPASETVVAASFAKVTFPPNVTASHVPAGGRLALRVAADVPAAEQVQAALGRNVSGSGPELIVHLQSVVEVGAEAGPRIMFDLPVRIALEGQAGGRAFYIEGGNGMIVPIDGACAADGVGAVHRQLGGAGECQMDSADGTAKIVYTYHLTKFGTVSAEGPVPVRTDAVGPPAPIPPVVVVPPVNGTFGGGGGGGGNATNGTAGPPTPQPVVPPTPQPVVPPTPQPQQPPGGDGGQPVVPPTGEVDTCAVDITYPALDMSARPGEYSDPVVQVVQNEGTLLLERVEIEATPWHDGSGPPTPPPMPGVPPPYSGPTQGRTAGAFTAYMIASLPASVTEVTDGGSRVRPDGTPFFAGGGVGTVALADDGRGTAVLEGLEPGWGAHLSFRLNLTPYDGLLAGALVQSVTYQAECAPPSTSPAP